jgi:hypothetical protein
MQPHDRLFLNTLRAMNEVCREETESTSAPESDNARSNVS